VPLPRRLQPAVEGGAGPLIIGQVAQLQELLDGLLVRLPTLLREQLSDGLPGLLFRLGQFSRAAIRRFSGAAGFDRRASQPVAGFVRRAAPQLVTRGRVPQFGQQVPERLGLGPGLTELDQGGQ